MSLAERQQAAGQQQRRRQREAAQQAAAAVGHPAHQQRPGDLPGGEHAGEGGDAGVPVMVSDDIISKAAFMEFAGNAARGIAMRNANLEPTKIQEMMQ